MPFGVTVGTWTRIQNYFLYPCDGSTLGPNGGYGGNLNHTHTLTKAYANMGAHSNGDFCYNEVGFGTSASYSVNYRIRSGGSGVWQNDTHNFACQLVGSTDNQSAIPPYYRVSCWYRSA